MGTCYNLILEDEWNWHYENKNSKLKEFEDKYRENGYIEKIAEWDHFVVYNVEKSCPNRKERKQLIRDFADRAYYTSDIGSGIHEIDLPRQNTASLEKDKSINRAKEVRKLLK